MGWPLLLGHGARLPGAPPPPPSPPPGHRRRPLRSPPSLSWDVEDTMSPLSTRRSPSLLFPSDSPLEISALNLAIYARQAGGPQVAGCPAWFGAVHPRRAARRTVRSSSGIASSKVLPEVVVTWRFMLEANPLPGPSLGNTTLTVCSSGMREPRGGASTAGGSMLAELPAQLAADRANTTWCWVTQHSRPAAAGLAQRAAQRLCVDQRGALLVVGGGAGLAGQRVGLNHLLDTGALGHAAPAARAGQCRSGSSSRLGCRLAGRQPPPGPPSSASLPWQVGRPARAAHPQQPGGAPEMAGASCAGAQGSEHRRVQASRQAGRPEGWQGSGWLTRLRGRTHTAAPLPRTP